MENSKHTPGPWAIRDDDEDGVVSIVGSSQIVLARVRTATVEPGDENARLIAAAPELLAELKELREFFYGKYGYGNDDEQIKRLRRADAAISKATGG